MSIRNPETRRDHYGTTATRKVGTRRRPPKISLVVACSERKRIPANPELQLRSVGGYPKDRVVEWRERLDTVDARLEIAETLYAGPHWYWAREAHRLTLQFSNRAELWIASAGYGLIPAGEMVKPYGATFAPGALDSVWRGHEDGERVACLAGWWRSIGRRGSLADLVAKNQGVLVFAAGAAYVEAAEDDLRDAVGRDRSSERVTVISAGSRDTTALVPVDVRMRRVVGGTNSALNARVLAWLASQAEAHRFERSAMAAILDRVQANLPTLCRPTRDAVTDASVAAEIRRIRRTSPGISRTRALGEFRARGLACEQRRFASIWMSVSAD